MTEKINLFIIDKDLRVRESGKFEVGDADKIRYKSGGTENWNPLIGETTFLEKKGWKKYLLFGQRNWVREYYVLRKGDKCIDFRTEDVPTPDPKKLKLANAGLLAKDIGKDSTPTTPWQLWAAVIFSFLSFIMMLNMSGVLR
jgi:hypothetical protein